MGKPEIGVSTLYSLSKPFNEMLKNVLKLAVRNIEIVDEGLHALDKKKVSILKDVGESYDIKFSVHAPFADINIASPSQPILKAIIKRLKTSIKHASNLEAYLWVFHPGLRTGISMFYPETDWLQNRKTAQLLFKNASDYGLKIAIENVPEPYPFLMKSVEDFEKFYQEISEDIGLALDIGHSNINGQTELFLKNFADKIVHIHAHDNHGDKDSHLGVGYGTVNWKTFKHLLQKASYDKVIIVESIEKVAESVSALKSMF